MSHPLLQVLNSAPINRTAKVVTSQKHCDAIYRDADKFEIRFAVHLLTRKMRLMKMVLKITTRSQHKNTIYRHSNLGYKSQRGVSRRLIGEYARVGQSIQILNKRLAEINSVAKGEKELRQRLGAVENKWREAHPGCIWDGRKLVAPTGEVFSRAAAAMEAA